MKFGSGLLTCQQADDDPRSTHEMYANMLEFGRTADEVGFDSVWVSEHHFSDDGYMPSTMNSLSALAAVTDSVDLGTYITPLSIHNPYRIAEDTATVDVISNGRLKFGIGLGYLDREFEGFAVPKEERVERTEDTIDIMRDAWSDGPVEYDSDIHDVNPGVEVTPKPSRDGGVPVLIGGVAKPAVARAARMGDGYCAPADMSIEDIVKRKNFIEELREEEDIEGDFEFVVATWGGIGDSEEDAWETIRDGFLHVHSQYREFQDDEDWVDEVREGAIIGSPEDVVEEIEAYREALGDDIHFMYRTNYPNMNTEELRKSLELVGEEVIPHFTD